MKNAICAISTAYGEGGIGIVRVSGSDAFSIMKAVFRPKNGAELKGRVLRYGEAFDSDGTVIDEVLGVFMKGPHSYTGEDVFELQCHGGLLSTRKILEACNKAGARLAEPGEFTRLAFLNGRLDLAEAESVIDLIEANSDKAYDQALRKMQGALSKEIHEIREALMDQLVLLAVNIDYPDEDIELATLKKLEDALLPIRNRIQKLDDSSQEGKLYREGLSVVLVGRPNVGKSSLLNRFLNEDRAIVTSIPGTTRDTIEESATIGGFRVKFTDTAGIRETDDPIEKIGVDRSRDALRLADLTLFLLDASSPLTEEDRELSQLVSSGKTMVLLNKSDAGSVLDEEKIRAMVPDDTPLYRISAKNGDGVDLVKAAIEKALTDGTVTAGDGLVITSLRQKESIRKALESIDDALLCIKNGEALDLVEVGARSSWEALGEIIGETATEDIVDRVFERFCLGK